MIDDEDDVTRCPICDKIIWSIGGGDEDYYSPSYYCSSLEPFYHVYKLSDEEEVFMCDNGKLIYDTGDIFMTHKITTIIYKDKSVVINEIVEFNPKELPGFIKAAVNNIAFL